MKNYLRILAALVGLIALIGWLATGAHRGWTQTRVTTLQVDPVTELEYPVTEDKFVAGVELLGGGLLIALLFFAGSFVFRKQSTATRKETTP
jgi:hypothetical protein